MEEDGVVGLAALVPVMPNNSSSSPSMGVIRKRCFMRDGILNDWGYGRRLHGGSLLVL